MTAPHPSGSPAAPTPQVAPPHLAPGHYRPQRPRLIADVLLALGALILLGLPSILLSNQQFDAGFFIFGIQSGLNPAGGSLFAVVGTLINLTAAIGMPLAVIWRANRPVLSTGITAGLALSHFSTGVLLMPVDLLIFVSLYSITVYGPRKYSTGSLFLALAGGLLISLSAGVAVRGIEGLFIVGLLLLLSATLVLLSWGAGLLRRSRLEQRETLRERARRLERERDQQAQIATVAERNRIAREMHDIVAHSLSVVVAQADGGRYAAQTDPQAATRALETIAETSRAALADMRRILGVLRDEDGETTKLLPQPADSDLTALIAQVKDAGLPVSQVTIGAPRHLPAGTGVAIYRIVQESLTNILKHAGPQATAIVTTAWSPVGLSVTIDDDGRGAAAASDGSGHGLVGMRERAAMLGGTLSAGPKPGGGFRVIAHVPLPNQG